MTVTSTDYVELAMRTATEDFDAIESRFSDGEMSAIVHGAIGLAGESGELLDAIKKHIYYGNDLDVHNIIEELGDAMWYIARVCDALGVTLDDVMTINIDKLRARHGSKFRSDNATTRNIAQERKIIEKKHSDG